MPDVCDPPVPRLLDGEELLPLTAAVHRATGQRPHPSTVARWVQGSRGVRLESAKLGHRRMTSVEAVRRFIVHRTAVADGPATVAPTAAQLSRAQAEAEAILAREGI